MVEQLNRNSTRSESSQIVSAFERLNVSLQRQIPVLADHVLAEASALLARAEAKARLLVDVSRGGEHAVGPQRYSPIAAGAREGDAFSGQAPADAEPARGRLDQQEAQPGDLVGVLHQQHAADVLPVELGDEAALAARVEFVHEVGDDLRAHAFE